MSTLGELTLWDLVKKEHGWDCRPVGPFRLRWWAGAGPPRWQAGPVGFYATEFAHARAFLGGDAGLLRVVAKALKQAARELEKTGLSVYDGDHVDVVLWDPAFPLPPTAEFQGVTRLDNPMTFTLRKPFTIVLPTRLHGQRGAGFRDWLRTTTVHEALHGILWSYLCLNGAPDDLQRRHWTKFEEMCAVAFEYRLAGTTRAWQDYGHAWQASLALSHSRCDWPLDVADWDSEMSVNYEEYGQFPFLAWLDETVWPSRKRPAHWMPLVWQRVRDRGWPEDPWRVLNELLEPDGGLAAVFRWYVREAAFPSIETGVLGRLHKDIGPPVGAHLLPGEQPRIFVLGMMAAQLLHCAASPASTSSLIVTAPETRHAEVEAWWTSTAHPGGHRRIAQIAVIRKNFSDRTGEAFGKTKMTIWTIPLGACPAGFDGLRVSVCQPDTESGSVVFTAEVR